MRLPVFAIASLAILGLAMPARAQDCRLLCAPVFVAQPGVVISNAINPPEVSQGVEAESSTDFLFRVTTVIPTTIPRTTLVGIIQWTPFSNVLVNGSEFTTNAPAFVYGPVFSLFSAGPISTTFDVLGVYAPSPDPDQAYKHQLLLEFDVGLSLGAMMGPDAPPFLRQTSLYAFLAQQISDLPTDFRGDKVYSPALLFGVTLPIAPLP